MAAAMIATSKSNWLHAVRWYLGVSLTANIVWEVVQLPLYTIGSTGSLRQQTFAVLHCTLGDVMIAALSLLAALLLVGQPDWPRASIARVYPLSLALGLGYTIFSEWLNTNVRGSWSYSQWMPVLPGIGIGLSPVLQWLIVPTLAYMIAVGRMPRMNISEKLSLRRSADR